MALTKVINDLADLNQSGSTNALKGCAGTTAEQPASSSSIEYLIVGGGGTASGSGSGGGGAGGLLTGITTVYHGTPTVLTVGEGATGDTTLTNQQSNGNDSGFNGIRAIGGGSGQRRAIGSDGGAGGGGGNTNPATAYSGGSGTSGQGLGGGDGTTAAIYVTGGGGGAGTSVDNTDGTGATGSSGQSGNGGSGRNMQSFISSTNATKAGVGEVIASAVWFAGGGGGGGVGSGVSPTALGGTGGSGGGGAGSGTSGVVGTNGTSNTGGGGGGGVAATSDTVGGNGGSGVGVIKYNNTIVTGYTLNSEDTYTVNWPADKFGVAYWPLNLDVKDVGGNYDGTATDITYTNGKFNQAASFNGSSSYIVTGFTLPPISTMSFSFWLYPIAFSGDSYIWSDLDSGGGGASRGLDFRFDSSGDFLVEILTTTNLTYAMGAPALGVWVNLVVTIDGNTVILYKNGSSVATSTTGSALGTAGPRQATIGRAGDYNGGYFDGLMEQIRVYTSVLSLTDVQDIYNNSKPGSLPPLKTSSDLTTDVCNFPTGVTGGGFYDFIGTANDTCGNNNGTFTNSSYSSTIAKFGESAGPFVYNFTPGSETRIYTGAGNEVTTTEGNKTLSAWVYPTGANTQGGFIVFANGKLVISYSSSAFYAYKYINGTDIFDTSCSGGQTKSITSSAIYAINTWHHVAVVMSGTGDYDFKLYVNGIDTNGTQGSTAFCGYDNSVNGGFIIGGTYNYQGTHYYNGFDGYIDRVRVYASALTDQNIYDLWQKENDIQTYFPDTPTSGTDTLVFKEGSGEITFKNDSPPGAEVGMLRYNSTLNKMEHFNSGGWKDFSYCTTDLCNYPTQANSVLLYRFNDNITDTCGTYNGVAGGSLSYDPGKFGKAINTTSGYIDTGYTLPAVSTVSVSCWIKMTSNPAADVYVMSDMNSSTDNRRLDIRIAGGSSNKLFIDNGNGSSDNQEDTGWSPTQDVWYNIVITFNGTAGILYVDGVSTYSYTSSVAVGTAGGQSEIIGRAGHFACCNFPGLIDQFRLFTSTLTADEVLDLYNEVQC